MILLMQTFLEATKAVWNKAVETGTWGILILSIIVAIGLIYAMWKIDGESSIF